MAELNSSGTHTRVRGRKVRSVPRIDLTAMVDLAFLLITFFIMTTTLTKQKTMPVVMPTDEPGTPLAVSEKRAMTICLGKNNKAIWYLGRVDKPIHAAKISDFGETGIRKAILDMKAYVLKTTGKSLMVIIKPGETSVYEDLVTTLDEMNITRVPSYAIADITQPDIDVLKQKGIY